MSYFPTHKARVNNILQLPITGVIIGGLLNLGAEIYEFGSYYGWHLNFDPHNLVFPDYLCFIMVNSPRQSASAHETASLGGVWCCCVLSPFKTAQEISAPRIALLNQ